MVEESFVHKFYFIHLKLDIMAFICILYMRSRYIMVEYHLPLVIIIITFTFHNIFEINIVILNIKKYIRLQESIKLRLRCALRYIFENWVRLITLDCLNLQKLRSNCLRLIVTHQIVEFWIHAIRLVVPFWVQIWILNDITIYQFNIMFLVMLIINHKCSINEILVIPIVKIFFISNVNS